MKYDIKFLSDRDGVVLIPLKVNGMTTGSQSVLQRFIVTLFTSASETRLFAGDLYSKLSGCNLSEDNVTQVVYTTALQTINFLNTSQNTIIGSFDITNVTVNNDTVVISAVIYIDNSFVDFEMNLSLNRD